MAEQQVRLLDSQFAKFLANRSQLSGEDREHFRDLVCRLSMTLAAGDSCLPVSKDETDLIQRSGLNGVGEMPLQVWQGRLYLQRFAEYEQSLALNVARLAVQSTQLARDDSFLASLFGEKDEQETDWQRLSAERALEQNFLIISGGPGTGKTTTVVKILALLLSASRQKLRIGLAAPTGKAAMRLQESIVASARHLSLPASILKNIPEQAATLHRLLGVKHFSPFFRHNKSHPLSFDVVVVDEASMVDLALMAKLVDALRPGSRLILLGDKNQLASVESGTVLADMISALPENTVELQKSYRFDEGIKGFAEAVNRGNARQAWELLESAKPANVALLQEDLAEYGGRIYCRYMKAVYKADTVEEYRELFALLHSFKILCAVRHGSSGVSGVNVLIEQYLTEKGYDCFASDYYSGRPVMITRNDYGLDLYNGDMGICLPDPGNPEVMKVWFERSDGRLQGLLPRRISHCETVYALTIHKSQGTEIGEVLVVLPEQESDLVTRELIYTAVTRARQCVKVKSSRPVFDRAVAGKIERHSGLAQRLVRALPVL
jgi:exodeoxyribonuclease V alpha subunit